MKEKKQHIVDGNISLGIELGSTRIKAILLDFDNTILGYGEHSWENKFEDGVWTYSLEAIFSGLKSCYAKLQEYVRNEYSVEITKISYMGISAMMHGYMAFDSEDNLLVPFRTWRNTSTGQAAKILTESFDCNIPLRWSIAHLYQSILNNEAHVSKIAYMTTLSGFINYMLTGEKVLGVGDAVGMFPVLNNDFDPEKIDIFSKTVKGTSFTQNLKDILPKVLVAGQKAGTLTKEGALLLDDTGALQPGTIFAPPEGDAGTGMVATNSITPRTANISAGTSIFSMVVLEKQLSKRYDEIDIVTTPSGDYVAMVHCNNCTSDLDLWVGIFKDFLKDLNVDVKTSVVFDTLYNAAMKGNADCGGLLSYNYLSGEHNTGFESGRPLFVRSPSSNFNLPNFMLSNLYSTLATLKIGMDILFKDEKIELLRVLGHGGLYKTAHVGQQITANALNAPVSVMETAAEGGAYGIAVLANYMRESCSLSEFLDTKVFAGSKVITVQPEQNGVAGFEKYINRYKKGFAIERAAVENLDD